MVDATVAKLDDDVLLKKGSLLYYLPLPFLGLGIIALIYLGTIYSLDPARAIYGYLYGFSVVLSLALGSMGFVLIQHLTRAGWSVVIRRIPETAMVLLPLFILFFLPIAFSTHDIFPWTHSDHIDAILAKKLPYLNEQFFFMRSAAYLLVWTCMSVWFYRLSVAQDVGGKDEITRYLQAVSAPGIIIYGLSLTFASFDWFMSLQPHWYSTIFGVYFFAGSFLFALAFITLTSMLLQKFGMLKNAISNEHYHDLGKLLFGFTVFWAYISFSQFMLYWYAAIPEEIEFYTHRLQHGWAGISWAIPIIHFFVPFLALMSRYLKRVKLVLAFNCLWIIAVHLIDLYWLILPTYTGGAHASEHPHMHISIVDILGLVGILFIFLGCFWLVFSRQKLVPTGDPRLNESLAFENF